MHFTSHYLTFFSSGVGEETLQDFPDDGLDHLVQSFSEKGLSPNVISNLLKVASDKSIKQYQSYWSRFKNWCDGRGVNSGNLSVNMLCKFFVQLYDSGLSASTLKFARSAVNFFLRESHSEIINSDIFSRLLKSFEKSRPTVPRYAVTWDVNKVLCMLRSWYPYSGMSLKRLTLKTCMLVALASSDRAQTIQQMRHDRCVISARGIDFPILSKLKTTRHLKKARVVSCPRWPDPALDVAECVTTYMNRCFKFRYRAVKRGLPKPTQLFLSHRSGLPVARNTISRWLTEVMSMAGIDTTYFTGHSTRVASVSKAKRRGANPNQIMLQGDWTNISTFTRHYDREILGPALGNLILGD